MAEDMDMSIDTSDVDTSDIDTADVDTADISEDVSEDIPEDTGYDDDYSDDYSDDISDEIPEDESYDDIEDNSEEDDEEIPEDTEPDGEYFDDDEENDLNKIPEDNVADYDDVEDATENVSEDGDDSGEDAIAEQEIEDIPEDIGDENYSDSEDSESDGISNDFEEDAEETESNEQVDDTQDEQPDDSAAEGNEDVVADTDESAESDEQLDDTQDEQLDDSAVEVAEDTVAETEDTAKSDEQMKDKQGGLVDVAAEGTEDADIATTEAESDESADDTQGEQPDDANEKNNQDDSDSFNDTVDNADNKKEYSDLSDKIQYLDKMRNDAASALSYDPARKDDWDVVRGRLSDEYQSASDKLKGMEVAKQAEYDQLRNEYFATNALPDSMEKAAKLEDLANKGRELSSEINDINSRARYADTLSQDLARDLDPAKRTSYAGVGGKDFTDIHKNMIQQQGNAVPDFWGTCGDCSAANTMNALGDTKTESEVVQRARDLKACTDKPIPEFLPEKIKNKIRGSNGGTSVAGRRKILDSFGYDCDNRQGQSLSDIANQLENGKGAIINVDHRVLNKQNDVSLLNPIGTDHALTITGIEKDACGNPIGLWIHDTGVCSNMGNAFYCNANDYATWAKTPNCTVQYVTKR